MILKSWCESVTLQIYSARTLSNSLLFPQSNGEKTNPVPIESTLRGSSTSISDAVIFGSGRSQIGALIILGESVPRDLSLEEQLDLLMPSVDLANRDAPSHSQLAREMIVVLPYGTVIPRADKGSFLRPKVYEQFKDTIEDAYKRLEGEGHDERKKRIGTEEEMVESVLRIVENVAADGVKLDADADLFDWSVSM